MSRAASGGILMYLCQHWAPLIAWNAVCTWCLGWLTPQNFFYPQHEVPGQHSGHWAGDGDWHNGRMGGQVSAAWGRRRCAGPPTLAAFLASDSVEAAHRCVCPSLWVARAPAFLTLTTGHIS
jgi:hypothetical protein